MAIRKITFTIILFTAFAIGLVIGVVGCGGGGGGGSPSTGQTSQQVAQSSQPPAPATSSQQTATLPLDPGEAGKVTLAGIDSDRDGVRDDVQRHIALTFPDSARTRAGLTQYTKMLQKAILEANSKQASIDNAVEAGRAIECIYHIRPDDAENITVVLEAQTFNTEERIRAYITYNEQLGGQIFPSTPLNQLKSACTFDPDTLEN